MSVFFFLFFLLLSSHFFYSASKKQPQDLQLFDDDPSITELHKAAYHDMVELSEYYLEVDPDSIEKKTTKEGFTPLLGACNRANKQIISLLLENGANPNTQDHTGLTCLHHLVRSEKASLVSFFIKECTFNGLKLDFDLGDSQKMTALHYVVFEVKDLREAEQMIDAFHKGGADLTVKNNQESMPLFVSILLNKYKVSKKILNFLVDYPPTVKALAPNSHSLTPFHVLFEGPFRGELEPLPLDKVQRYQVLELLLKRLDKEEPETLSLVGRSTDEVDFVNPLDFSKVEKSLLNHEVRIGEYFYSALHLVVYELDYPAIGLLMKAGALLPNPRSLTTETIWHTLEIKDEDEELVEDQLIRFFLLHTSEWTKADVQFWITTILRSKAFSPKKTGQESEEELKELQDWEKVKKRVYEHFSEIKGRTLLPMTDSGLETIINHHSKRANQLLNLLKSHLKEFKIGARSRFGFEEFWNIWDNKYPSGKKTKQRKESLKQSELF